MTIKELKDAIEQSGLPDTATVILTAFDPNDESYYNAREVDVYAVQEELLITSND